MAGAVVGREGDFGEGAEGVLAGAVQGGEGGENRAPPRWPLSSGSAASWDPTAPGPAGLQPRRPLRA